MKIFEINWESQGEKEWLTDMSIDDFEDNDSIIEIPKSKWGNYKVRQKDDDEITFKKWMKENPRPDIIAGTMYE